MTRHQGVYNDQNEKIVVLMTSMLLVPWQGEHTCGSEDVEATCSHCSLGAQWFSLAAKVTSSFCLMLCWAKLIKYVFMSENVK